VPRFVTASCSHDRPADVSRALMPRAPLALVAATGMFAKMLG
jgi:hypothetical protein